MSLAAGTRLGPYEIVAPLGAGGMGVVYRARDTRLDRVVALKVLSPLVSSDPQLRQRFDREARTISSLSHPNICALYDIGEADRSGGDPLRFLVMELIEGESLANRLLKGPLTLNQALQCAIEIIDALSSAHRRGIVHRDVKPGNVMLTKAGAKLLDFGLAKSGPAITSTSGPHDETTWTPAPSNLTAQGTVVGTFQYMAPEQLEGLDVDARSDIFAFGATLFEMITGRKAFAGRTQTSLIGAILRDEPPAPSSLVAIAPPALDRVVAKCLAKDPDGRWQDASDLRDELKWIAGGGAGQIAPPTVAAAGRKREWIAWSLLAIAVAGLAAVGARYRPAAPPPVVRFALSPPDRVVFAPAGAPVAPFPAVSPDGTRIAFVGNRSGEPAMLWVHSFEALDARPLNDTTVRTDTLSPALPFWSPDSKTMASSPTASSNASTSTADRHRLSAMRRSRGARRGERTER